MKCAKTHATVPLRLPTILFYFNLCKDFSKNVCSVFYRAVFRLICRFFRQNTYLIQKKVCDKLLRANPSYISVTLLFVIFSFFIYLLVGFVRACAPVRCAHPSF